ncbi:HAMP domain-containing sensor histidine kinase [Frigoribacterium sp. VKM Ac-2530]|uniref:sensor histidine kinase n=1 Tax=Frigoribacterium sp. VKM Ac-2530 TaxID=2783822 RepID=UPI00188D7203|nr:HAMP domain-containing histidine kinase [Frigoribacterium sp. VKM Ac-2530]
MTRPGTGTYWQRRRLSARARLTLTFTGLLFVVGAAIVTSVVVVMRYLPRYAITAVVGPSVDMRPSEVTAPTSAPAFDGVPATPDATTLISDSLTINGEGDLLRVLLTTSLVVFVVVLALGAWLSWVLAGRLLRPLDHLADAAREAELGQTSRRPALDHERLALAGPHDEFHRLASAFDDMLERLDGSYRAQQRFAANASHELRTPLATTQAMLDVALAEPQSVDLERLGTRLRETNTRSLRTVEALLTLADATAGQGDDRPVDLRELVVDALARAEPTAAAAGTTLVDDLEPAVVEGDPALLAALVTNLVDNALRHGRPGGRVEVVLRDRLLSVANDGDVLEPDEVARLTEAFHRGARRVHGAGGHGLGLAIVQAVADRHGARLELVPRRAGGLRVDVEF